MTITWTSAGTDGGTVRYDYADSTDSTQKGHKWIWNNSGTPGTTTWTPPTGIVGGTVRVLVIAGGGGAGGGGYASGGGAGGLSEHATKAVSGDITVVVGDGGAGGADGAAGTQGSDSSFDDIISNGGGRGNYYNGNVSGGYAGGSGSGAPSNSPSFTGGASNQGTTGGATGFGFKGGDSSASNKLSGGGGGAGGAGEAGTTSNKTHVGGIGRSNNITGADVTYAIGGDSVTTTGTNTDGTSNLGNGGSGGRNTTTGGKGGSGIVIIRYTVGGATNESGISLGSANMYICGC